MDQQITAVIINRKEHKLKVFSQIVHFIVISCLRLCNFIYLCIFIYSRMLIYFMLCSTVIKHCYAFFHQSMKYLCPVFSDLLPYRSLYSCDLVQRFWINKMLSSILYLEYDTNSPYKKKKKVNHFLRHCYITPLKDSVCLLDWTLKNQGLFCITRFFFLSSSFSALLPIYFFICPPS